MEASEIDLELVEELRQSKKKFGALAPIILDAHGNIVEGHHRNKADPTWPRITYDDIKTEEARVLYAIAFNWHRRDKTEAWKINTLSWLAKHGNNLDQIAEKTGLSKRTIYRYLPTELKGPEPEELARARLARESKLVSCDRCGVNTSTPFHFQGKFYCEQCAEKAAPQEKQREIAKQIEEEGKIPSVREISDTSEIERRTAEAPGTSAMSTAVDMPKAPEPPTPKPEEKDVADFTCPICHAGYRIAHVANNLHRLIKLKEEKA